MTAAKLRIPVVHVEACPQPRHRRMPEEINRLPTDAIGDVLFTPSRRDENLPGRRWACANDRPGR